MKVSGVSDGINMMRMRMSSTKVLLVLDDVDDIDQLNALAGHRSWFKKGSIIIITTRDENVLQRVNWVHNVNLLSREEAICLFSRLAFKKEVPIQGYEELSRQVVAYASGLPLTITVLGSHLCDKDLDEWKDALERLKTIPLEKTLQKLELSFLSLPEDRKNIFLNVACILKGWDKDSAVEALKSCGFHAVIGLKVLEQKSLITIYYDYNQRQCVGMHDHLQEMGENIVRRSDPEEPEKHSRLWVNKEIKDILANDLGTKATEYMQLHLYEIKLEIFFKGIRKMQKLRYLFVNSLPSYHEFYHEFYHKEQKYDLVSQYLPNALQYLRWCGYPFCCLPNTFQGDNLVALKMSGSKILRLWEGEERKVLSKLKVLELDNSRLTIVDLGLIPNVEVLNLEGCSGLVQFHTHHGSLKLKHVDLSSSRLETVDLRSALGLETLHLTNCYDLVKLHLPADGCLKLTQLHCTGSKLENLDLVLSPNLETMNPNQNKDLVRLNMPGKCQNLRSLELTDSKLTILNLGQTPNLEHLNLNKCYNLEELLMAEKCENLVSLYISYSFDLQLSRNFETFSESICELHRLIKLKLEFCPEAPKNLGQLECLEKLILFNTHMKHLPDSICRLKHLKILLLQSCSRLEKLPDDVGGLECLEMLILSSGEIKHLPDSICRLKHLKILQLQSCWRLEKLPDDVGGLECLKRLTLASREIKNLPDSICKLKHLIYLDLRDCFKLENLPKDLGQLECLEELYLTHTKIKHLPDSLCMLKTLKTLNLLGCSLLESVPANFGQLKCLTKLGLSSPKIKHLPDTFCMLKYLKNLDLDRCSSLKKLPEDLDRLECLQWLSLCKCKSLQDIPISICKLKILRHLDVTGTCISHLPGNICSMKGLEISGSRSLLESCGFTSEIKNLLYSDAWVTV